MGTGTAIIYAWGYGASAPRTIGNATREDGMEYDDYAANAANNVGFDVEMLNRDGKPAWAAAYDHGEAEFDPGEDRDNIVGYAD